MSFLSATSAYAWDSKDKRALGEKDAGITIIPLFDSTTKGLTLLKEF